MTKWSSYDRILMLILYCRSELLLTTVSTIKNRRATYERSRSVCSTVGVCDFDTLTSSITSSVLLLPSSISARDEPTNDQSIMIYTIATSKNLVGPRYIQYSMDTIDANQTIIRSSPTGATTILKDSHASCCCPGCEFH